MTETDRDLVLIVEDDAGVAWLEQNRLERAGYDVIAASTVEEALAQLNRHSVALILLDYRLPGEINGLDFFAQLKGEGKTLPVILVTGFSDEKSAIRALRAGVRDFISKSVEYLEYLPEAVGRVLKQVDTERRLAESEARLNSVINSAMDAIITIDPQGRITLFNVAAEQMFSCPRGVALARPIHDFIPDFEGALRQRDMPDHPTGNGRGHRYEFRGLRPDSGTFPLEATLSPTTIQEQSFLTLIARDITERKNLERQVLRTQRMESLGVLAGGIAHDLNNVLTPLMMGIPMLQMDLPAADRDSLLTTLQASVERGADMIKQILTFARGLEGTRQVLFLEPLIGEMIKLIKQSFPKSIEIRAEVPRELWPIVAEPTQIHQVLMNLCVNARDAMPSGGHLTIHAQNMHLDDEFVRVNTEANPGPYVLIKVEDSGVGISLSVLDKIFDPFFTTKGAGKGTGLGLSTTLGIVKSHGGFIKVYTEVGRGTSFSVYLPAANKSDSKMTRIPRQQKPTGRGEWILVVEDEVSIREIARATLESHGYRVLTANEGSEALSTYASRQAEISMVITDMMMPVMDGQATIAALRKINPHIRIIAASGFTPGRKLDESPDGAQAFLAKPYTADSLLRAVHDVLHS